MLGEKSERSWEIPHSGRTRISRTTILDWVRKYERGGQRIEALFPKDRKARGSSRVLDEEAVCMLRKVRQEMPTAPVLRLIEEMKIRGWIEKGDRLKEIGEAFGIGRYSTVSSVLERLKVRMKRDELSRKKVDYLISIIPMSQEQT